MPEHAEVHAEEHAHPNYVKIWLWLVVLLAISVVGPMFGIKALTLITAFGIALIKALLVARNFMHVNLEPKFVSAVLVTTLSIMVLMFFLVAPDVMNHTGQNWVNLAAAAPEIPPEPAEHEPAATESEPADQFDAKAVFQLVCASCHGAGGAGDGIAAAALPVKPADFTSAEFWQTRDRDSILKVIREGGAAVGKSPLMAPFGGTFDEPSLQALADHVLSLKP